MASAWAAIYTAAVWTQQFIVAPVHDDIRLNYVAAEAGLRYGWSTIYDPSVLRSLSASMPEATRLIDTQAIYASPPLLAWLVAPLTALPVPAAYVIWTVLSVAALVFAWLVASPYVGLARITLLLAALGLGPVLMTLYFGQPTLIVLALVAAAWWLTTRNRPWAAGALIATALFLKPQAVILLPAAILVSGRYRTFAAVAVAGTVLGLLTAIVLGSHGLIGWWQAVRGIQRLQINTAYTLAQPFGTGPLTIALWIVQGALALFVAWRRRHEVEMVFAAGVLGTVATVSYFHNSDYAVLLIAAWLALRTSPPLWHRLWLLAGIVPMQLLLTNLLAGPQLIWDAGWLLILAVSATTSVGVRRLAVEPVPALDAKAVPSEVVVTARGADEAAGRVGL